MAHLTWRLNVNTCALRQKAISKNQSLIEHIKVTPTDDGYDITLYGELGSIMDAVGQSERRPVGGSTRRSL